MGLGRGEQLEKGALRKYLSSGEKKYGKKHKARRERRRAKKNPEVMAEYGKYKGWAL